VVVLPQKDAILEKLLDSRTAHLQPLIDFLIAQGNLSWLAANYRPLGGDEFIFDRDGFGTFYCTDLLDFAAVREHFVLPATSFFTPGGPGCYFLALRGDTYPVFLKKNAPPA
jgi:hypothetical protein